VLQLRVCILAGLLPGLHIPLLVLQGSTAAHTARPAAAGRGQRLGSFPISSPYPSNKQYPRKR
jgi:hypothetical protein